jgi:esterase/lipase superfamily enzyme
MASKSGSRLLAAGLGAVLVATAGGPARAQNDPRCVPGRESPISCATPTPARAGSSTGLLLLGGLLVGAAAVIQHHKNRRTAATPSPSPPARRQATAPPRFRVAILGTVSDELDRPVAGASVEVAGEPRLRPARAVAQAPAATPYSQRRAYVETDVNGRYVVALQLSAGTYQLVVSAYGKAVERIALDVSGAAQFVENVVVHSASGASVPYARRAVYYATERKAETASGGPSFGGAPAAPNAQAFGTADVSVPVASDADVPRGSHLDHSTDPGAHAFVRRPVPATRDAFFAALRKDAERSSSGSVLLFVHGYNQTFEQTLRAAGQLRAGLGADAPAVVYDWPSKGDLTAYADDEARAHASSAAFGAFVTRLARELPRTRIELVGHSMGNRLVTALLEGSGSSGATAVRLDHVVMAAADVPTPDFAARLGKIPSSAGHILIYASKRDQALLLSSVLHTGPRLGYFEQSPFVAAGIDTVDASSVDTSILGHGYFDEEQSVLADMQRALAGRVPPRDHLRRIAIDAQYAYWRIVPR